jgi:hypothetical protein
MAVNLSPVGGAAAQFFTNSGVILSGGKLWTYAAGTTTPQTTYTSSSGNIAHNNYITLDSAGRVPGGEIWLTAGVSYKFALYTSADVLIGTYDNVSGISDVILPISSSSVTYLPAGTGAVLTTVQAKLRQYVSVKDFGAVGNGVTDDTAAIQAAINSTAQAIYFPQGTYLHSQTLIFKNSTKYYGDGCIASVLNYSGVSDQIQINNPINSSTAANIIIQDLGFTANSQNAGKAHIADVGSTFLTIERCKFYGAMIGVILDQSELVRMTGNEFILGSSVNSIGIWLVFGPDHTPLADNAFTNQIVIEKNQFNGSVGNGITDDGGYDHEYRGNNFNGMTLHLRVCNTNGFTISGGEYEYASAACISFQNTRNNGTPQTYAIGGITIQGGLYAQNDAAIPCFSFVANAVSAFNLLGNSFSTTGAVVSGIGYVSDVMASGNIQLNSGSEYLFINNYYDNKFYGITWAGSVTNPSIGNGSLFTTFSRNGRQVTINVKLTIGSTTTLGSGSWLFSLPFTAINDNVFYLGTSVQELSAATYVQASRVVQGASNVDFIGPTGVGSAFPGVWSTGDRLTATVTYSTQFALG